MLIAIVTVGCGGGEGQIGTVVGPPGGTVSGPNGAKVVIPPGALTTDVTINIEQTSDGAPPLPGGFSAFGQMYAFTPHGTTFAVPVTLTLPFDAASVPAGVTPALYKTNAQNQWEQVANATVDAETVSARVTSFSYGEPGLDPQKPAREWDFKLFPRNGQPEVLMPAPDGNGTLVGGPLEQTIRFGNAFFDLPYVRNGVTQPADGFANGFIFSAADGGTYGVFAEAPYFFPAGNNFPDGPIGSVAHLNQKQSFIKSADDASLTFTLTQVSIDATDFRRTVRPEEARFAFQIEGEVFLSVRAYKNKSDFFFKSGRASVRGDGDLWVPEAIDENNTNLWSMENFDFAATPIFDGFGGGDIGCAGTGVVLKLKSPRTYTVNLSSVRTNEEFTLEVDTFAKAINRKASGLRFECQASSASAYLRDPLGIGGTMLTIKGLEPTNRPLPAPPARVLVPPASCVPGPDNAAAGVLQFDAASYTISESAGSVPTITVTRTDGSTGAVTATFTTSDGTAIGGTDYTPVNATVFFGDGDAGRRVVPLPIIQDLLLEPDKTVNLTLSEPGGCATLGTQASAVLTILDDDRPPPVSGFTVGGTVTGLVGTGLVLTSAGLNLSPGSGPFTFPQPLPVGIPYNVSVVTQPTNPNQVCTVTNGSGTIGDADITNVVVDCVTLPTNGALDPTFGSGGQVTGPGGSASAIALQASDGKIVVVGGQSLSRYKPDGSLDTSFGAGGEVPGVVPVVFTGALDDARAVAIQPDGKIVVAGVTRGAGPNDFGDFAVARYDGNGRLDPDFGTGGKVTTDFNRGFDEASAIRVQTDGKLVVAGNAAASASFPVDNDFAVARYTSAGALDTSFGTGGKVTTNVAGRTDLVNAAVLQSNGKIVIAGRVADGDAVEPDLCLVRYNGDGTPDMGFGGNGIVRSDLGLGNWEEATDLVMQPDGKIVVSTLAVVRGKFTLGVARFFAAGGIDANFGMNGVATAEFLGRDDANAVALQPDGKIIVAGVTSSLTTSDFAIARFDAFGMLDSSFGTGGMVTVDFFGGSDDARCVAVQTDGKIVVAGFASTGLALARLNP